MEIKQHIKRLSHALGFDVVRYVPECKRPFDVLSLVLGASLKANKPFFFVQIGANDGVLDDPLRRLVLEHKPTDTFHERLEERTLEGNAIMLEPSCWRLADWCAASPHTTEGRAKLGSPYTRLGLAVAGLLLSISAFAQGHRQDVTAIEVAMLPHFCWSQYKDNLPPSPEYRIEGCGPGMNHYCPGLVAFDRAKKLVGDKTNNKKKQLLKVAIEDAHYTLKWMQDYPACAIRPHVEKTLAQMNAMLKTTK